LFGTEVCIGLGRWGGLEIFRTASLIFLASEHSGTPFIRFILGQSAFKLKANAREFLKTIMLSQNLANQTPNFMELFLSFIVSYTEEKHFT